MTYRKEFIEASLPLEQNSIPSSGEESDLAACPDAFHYFAYGSNLKLSEIQRSCPSAVRVAKAVLPDHRLTFPRLSKGRSSGVAGLQAEPGSFVWGGVYSIAESDRSELECREGFQEGREMSLNAYFPSRVTVLIKGGNPSTLEVLTFFANSQSDPPLPSADYLGLILDGAREWDIDPDYIAQLEQIETS